MSSYLKELEAVEKLRDSQGEAWNGINPESAVLMQLQHPFQPVL